MKLPLILLTTVLWSACGGLPDPGLPPRPEHPHVEMERAEWLNLNGIWAFRSDPAGTGLAENWAGDPPRFSSSSAIPASWPSEAAGSIGWYRRAFVVPSHWIAQNVWLHIEGVGGKATIWIDGKPVGSASNGFRSEEFDVTALTAKGVESEIVVRVESSSEMSKGLIGTVWLEGRPRSYLASVEFQPTLNGDSWAVDARVVVHGAGSTVDVAIESSDPAVASSRTSIDIDHGIGETVIRLPLAGVEPWTPESPRTYPLTIRVTALGDEVDTVSTYFGIRTIERTERQIRINGAAQYFRGLTIPSVTAETDEALRAQLERYKTLGFNLIYSPAGVEPRLHYWADRLGLWVLGDEGEHRGPSHLPSSEMELSETGHEMGTLPLLITVGPQPLEKLPQFFRDFTNRVRRLDFAQGYIWGAEIPDTFGYEAVVPDMTAADLQGPDYVGVEGAASFEAKPGDKLTLVPYMSRFSSDDTELILQVTLRAVNDLGGTVEFFSEPRRVDLSAGRVAQLQDIVMTVPQGRGLTGTLAFELLDESRQRHAANYVPFVVRAFDAPRSPRTELIAPRRTALRVEPGEHDEAESVEYSFPLAASLIAAKPSEVEVLVELSSSGPDGSSIRATLNGRQIGELDLPHAPQGPAALLGDGPRYGYLARLRADLIDDDFAAPTLILRLEPVSGGVTVFGETSGRYAIDPTIVVVTENVPESIN